MFTLNQAFAFIIAGIGLILTILNIYDKLTNIKKSANAPMKDVQSRLTTVEVEIKDIKRSLNRGNDDFRDIRKALEAIEATMSIIVDFEVSFCDRMDYKEGSAEIIEARKRLREFSARE